MAINDEIRKPEILTKIGKLASAGMSWTGISKVLDAENKITAGPNAVKGAYETYAARTTEIIAGDSELKGLIKADVLDVVDQMKRINAETWHIINDLQESSNKQPDTVLRALKEIRGQLELNMRLSDMLSQRVDFSKVNKAELTQNIINIYEGLQKDGFGEIEKCPRCGYQKCGENATQIQSILKKRDLVEIKANETSGNNTEQTDLP